MASINTNAVAMAAIRSLASINRDLGSTQSRIESGFKINKANDDPAVFSIAQRIRADLNGLDKVRDSQAFGKATLSVMRDALTKVSNELATLKGTITQGQQQGIDINQINQQITGSLANIDVYVNSASFNGVNLLNGTTPALRVMRDIQGTATTVAGTNNTTGAGGLNLAGLNVASGAFRLTFNATFAPDDGQGIRVVVGAGPTARTFAYEFNNNAALAATPGPNITVRQVEILGGDSPLQRLSKMMTAMRADGFDASFQDDGSIIIRNATSVFNGGVGMAAVTGTTAAVIPAAAGAIAQVDGALTTVGTRLSTIAAALRQVEELNAFSANLRDALREGLGALVDADLAEESARLTSLQTKQQLSVQSISIANQQGQSILSLFR
jgi:flagellin